VSPSLSSSRWSSRAEGWGTGKEAADYTYILFGGKQHPAPRWRLRCPEQEEITSVMEVSQLSSVTAGKHC